MAGIQLRPSPDPASYRTVSYPGANALFLESNSTSPRGKLTQQITPIGEIENLVNESTDPTRPNLKLPRIRLERSRGRGGRCRVGDVGSLDFGLG